MKIRYGKMTCPRCGEPMEVVCENCGFPVIGRKLANLMYRLSKYRI